MFEFETEELDPENEQGEAVFVPVTGTEINVTVTDEYGQEVELLDEPVTIEVEIPEDIPEDELVLFQYDPEEDHWIDVLFFLDQSLPPLLDCRQNTIRFRVQHLTQFQVFHRRAQLTDPCRYQSCEQWGYCVQNNCQDRQRSEDIIPSEQCLCLPGHEGGECQTPMLAERVVWPVLRWSMMVAWLVLFGVSFVFFVRRWNCERTLPKYKTSWLWRKSGWQNCWLILFGSAIRIIWLVIDPYTQSHIIPPELDYVLGGLYLPISLCLHAGILYNWITGVLRLDNAKLRTTSGKMQITHIYQFARIGSLFVFPFSIVGDTLLGLNTKAAAATAGFIINLVVLAVFVVVSIGLSAVGMIYLRRVYHLFAQLKGGWKNIIRLTVVIGLNLLVVFTVIGINLLTLKTGVVSFLVSFMWLEVALLVEWGAMVRILMVTSIEYESSQSRPSGSNRRTRPSGNGSQQVVNPDLVTTDDDLELDHDFVA